MAHLLICARSNLWRTVFNHGHDTVTRIYNQSKSISEFDPVRTLHHLRTFRHDRHTIRFCHTRSSSAGNKPNFGSQQNARRRRIVAYMGGFVLIHLSVMWGRRYYKNQDNAPKAKNTLIPSIGQEYVDPDLGKAAKMFHYKGYLLPLFAKESLQSIEEFAVKDNDVFVSSFPKSGTTWVQEIVYLIEAGVASTQDENMEQRFPYMEFVYPGMKEISRQEGQRLIKTHMPHSLLPADVRSGKGKVIYVARNPKDVSVSYFHYVRMLSEVKFNGTFEQFFNKFINDKVAYGPWWKHVGDYWDHRDDSNVLFLTYEELQQDLAGSVARVAHFLGRVLTPAQVSAVAGRCSFTAMQQNPASNYSWWDDLGLRRKGEAAFMRKGVVGDWQNYYTPDMMGEIDEMCTQRLGLREICFIDKLD